MISPDEILMGRDKEYPLDKDLKQNLATLIMCLNKFREAYRKPMVVTSGYRPGNYNKKAGGAPNSSHITCEACDFRDTDGSLAQFCTVNLDLLKACSLYMEDPAHTHGWVHLTTRRPPSGARVFMP